MSGFLSIKFKNSFLGLFFRWAFIEPISRRYSHHLKTISNSRWFHLEHLNWKPNLTFQIVLSSPTILLFHFAYPVGEYSLPLRLISYCAGNYDETMFWVYYKYCKGFLWWFRINSNLLSNEVMCLTDIHFPIHRFSLNIVCNVFFF